MDSKIEVKGYKLVVKELKRTTYWTAVHPTFFHFVGNIIGMSSKKKMIRVYAESIIAMMKNVQIIRYFPFVYNPRKTMSFNFSFIFWNPKLSITFLKFCANPIPAMVGFLYLQEVTRY